MSSRASGAVRSPVLVARKKSLRWRAIHGADAQLGVAVAGGGVDVVDAVAEQHLQRAVGLVLAGPGERRRAEQRDRAQVSRASERPSLDHDASLRRLLLGMILALFALVASWPAAASDTPLSGLEGHPRDRFPLRSVDASDGRRRARRGHAARRRRLERAVPRDPRRRPPSRPCPAEAARVRVNVEPATSAGLMGVTYLHTDDTGVIQVPVSITVVEPTARGQTSRETLLYQVLAHELGHALGLPHVRDARSLMCCEPARWTSRTRSRARPTSRRGAIPTCARCALSWSTTTRASGGVDKTPPARPSSRRRAVHPSPGASHDDAASESSPIPPSGRRCRRCRRVPAAAAGAGQDHQGRRREPDHRRHGRGRRRLPARRPARGRGHQRRRRRQVDGRGQARAAARRQRDQGGGGPLGGGPADRRRRPAPDRRASIRPTSRRSRRWPSSAGCRT